MFLFLVLIVLSFTSFISVICLWLKNSEVFFMHFLLIFFSTFYKNCLHVRLLVGFCIILSFHSLQRFVSLFYVVFLSFKRQTFSFTASSTSLPDSLLLLFNLPLNVNHSKKDQLFFILMVQTEKFSSIKRLPNSQLLFHSVFCWTQNDTFFPINFCRTFLGLYSKTQYQLRDFA